MTQREQGEIVGSIINMTAGGYSLRKRIRQWGQETFCDGNSRYNLGYGAGWSIQCRTAGMEGWLELSSIGAQSSPTESRDDVRRREVQAMNIFSDGNKQSSNNLGDVTEVRCVPYVSLQDRETNQWIERYKEDEARIYPCTDTGEAREWNTLEVHMKATPSDSARSYHIALNDIQPSDDVCWYLPWHFSQEADAPCPVAPIIVEEADAYHIAIRYREQRFELRAAMGQQHSVVLEQDKPVEPTHNWYEVRMPEPFRFTIELQIVWDGQGYRSTDKEKFQTVPPQQYATGDLPSDVRTMQQRDHDAWEEATGRRFVPEGY